MKKTFKVHWTKTYHTSGVVEVHASSPEEAEKIVCDQISAHEADVNYIKGTIIDSVKEV